MPSPCNKAFIVIIILSILASSSLITEASLSGDYISMPQLAASDDVGYGGGLGFGMVPGPETSPLAMYMIIIFILLALVITALRMSKHWLIMNGRFIKLILAVMLMVFVFASISEIYNESSNDLIVALRNIDKDGESMRKDACGAQIYDFYQKCGQIIPQNSMIRLYTNSNFSRFQLIYLLAPRISHTHLTDEIKPDYIVAYKRDDVTKRLTLTEQRIDDDNIAEYEYYRRFTPDSFIMIRSDLKNLPKSND